MTPPGRMSPRGRSSRPRRSERLRGLVVSEGSVTELEYVERLRQQMARDANAVIVKAVGIGKDPAEVVRKAALLAEQADRAGKGYDWVCCLVDVDTHARLPAALTEAQKQGLHVVVSNLKFEVWLLWHKVWFGGPQSTSQLDRMVKEEQLLEGKHLAVRFPIENYPAAVEYAHRADPDLADRRKGPDPSSSMPLLLDLMKAPKAPSHEPE